MHTRRHEQLLKTTPFRCVVCVEHIATSAMRLKKHIHKFHMDLPKYKGSISRRRFSEISSLQGYKGIFNSTRKVNFPVQVP